MTSRSRRELRYAIACGIEVTYFRRRRKKALGKLLPVDFEKIQELALGHTLKGYRDVPHLR